MGQHNILSGDAVRVLYTGEQERDLMYAGWYGVATKLEGGRAFVESDEFVRRTGKMQAVSFRQWFPLNEIESLEVCRGCGLRVEHKMCVAWGTPAYCEPPHPAWGNADKLAALKESLKAT